MSFRREEKFVYGHLESVIESKIADVYNTQLED